MRRLLLTAVAATAFATPAIARDGQPYVGIEGGVVFGQNTKFDVGFDDFDLPPGDPLGVAEYDNGIKYRYKKPGWEVDAIAGYDFGPIRAEAEVSYKRLKAKSLNFSPALAADLGLPDTGPYDPDTFLLDNKASALSGMVNLLFDVGNDDAFGFYGGGGIGYTRVKMFDDKDSAFAWQLIAGVRQAVSENVDIGLKYRYFNTGNLDFVGVADGGPDLGLVGVGGSGKLRTHSLLASLTYNFGRAAEPAPPPPPPPPPPPQTQTCPDGTVITVDQACPPPPPPPPPAPERG